ncbi:MAG: CHAT domain-containing protein [Byssovorax sp.]
MPDPSPAPSVLPWLGQIVPRWSRETVTAVHNERFPDGHPTDDTATIPDDARVALLVDVTHVDDETPAPIRVRHATTGLELPGIGVRGAIVRGDRVIDPRTGEPPELTFTAANMPWQVRQTPYFYFEVTIGGRAVQTPRDFRARPAECLRVITFSAAVACVYTSDASLTVAGTAVRLPPLRSTAPEAEAVAEALGRVPGSAAAAQVLASHRISARDLGALLRNTAVAHLAAHGLVAHRTEPRLLAHPPEDGADPREYRSLLVLGRDLLGDEEIHRVTDIPSVPRYLLYLSACLGGWEPSLCEAAIARGCRYVIAFQSDVFDDESLAMAREFYARWAAYGLEPSKIPECFYQVAPRHEARMRPVLFGEDQPRPSPPSSDIPGGEPPGGTPEQGDVPGLDDIPLPKPPRPPSFSPDAPPPQPKPPMQPQPRPPRPSPRQDPLAAITPGALWGTDRWSILRSSTR